MKLGRPSKKLALSVFAGVVTLVLVGVGLFQAVGASDGPTPREKNWSAPRDIAVKSDEMQVELEESIPERQLLELEDGSEYVANELMLRFDGEMDERALAEMLSEYGVELASAELVSDSLPDNEVLVLARFKGNVDIFYVIDRLEEAGAVNRAEPNFVQYLADDASSAEEAPSEEELTAEEEEPSADQDELSWHSNDPYAWRLWEHGPVGVNAAWDVAWCGGSTITVAVIDSGIDYDHPDFRDNLILNAAKNTYTGSVGASAVDDVIGHGTHVSGTISAMADNNAGVAGISYNAKVLPIKVTYGTDGKMYVSDVIEAIDYIVELKTNPDSSAYLKDIRVINLSLGGYNYSSAYQDAVKRAQNAGILVVAAGGNDYTSRNHYPSAYPGVIGVSALKEMSYGAPTFDRSYSNYGTYIDVSAPGTDIYSTIPGGSYGYKTGTSMATPVVSGVASLVFAANPPLGQEEVADILCQTSQDLGSAGWDSSYGHGMVRADRAVHIAGKKQMSSALVDRIPNQLYTGSAVEPAVRVTHQGVELRRDVDYSVSYRNNVEVGTAEAVITGKGDYAGEKVASFNIVKESISLDKPTVVEGLVYNGEEQTGVNLTPNGPLNAVSWGRNWDGQLGNGSTSSSSSIVELFDDVICVAAGGAHSAAVTSDGSLFVWGKNNYGQIGDGTTIDRPSPVKVLDGVKQVSLGDYHTLALKEDGSVWAWGSNYDGRVGDGTKEDRAFPVKVMEGVRFIDAGSSSSAAITTEGDYYGWGNTRNFGGGSYGSTTTPYKVMSGVVDVSLGCVSHGVAVTGAGELYTWGDNSDGQLGTGTKESTLVPTRVISSGVESVVAGGAFTIVVMENGDLMACGDNSRGQLGNGTTVGSSTFVKVFSNVASASAGYDFTAAIDAEGALYAWGNIDNWPGVSSSTTYVPEPYLFMEDCAFVSCGEGHALALKSNGYIVSGPTEGILPGTYQAKAALCGVAEWSDGTVDDVDLTWSIAKRTVEYPSVAAFTYDGAEHTGVSEGTGYTLSGSVKATDAGSYEVVATLDEYSTWPDGSTDPYTMTWSIEPKKIELPVQEYELPYTGSEQQGIPEGEGYTIIRGNQATEQGSYIAVVVPNHPNYVWADGTSDFKEIPWSIGAEQFVARPSAAEGLVYNGQVQYGVEPYRGYTLGGTCAATNAGTYSATVTLNPGYHWDSGQDEPLTIEWSIAPQPVADAAARDVVYNGELQYALDGLAPGSSTEWLSFPSSDVPQSVASKGIVQLASSLNYAEYSFQGDMSFYAAIVEDGSLWMWGNNSKGQLGTGSTSSSWQSSPVKVLDNVKEVSLGWFHTVAVTNDGELWAWGLNNGGQLGDGTTTDRHSPSYICSNVEHVSSRGLHTGFIDRAGDLWVFGANADSQLGNGSNTMVLLPEKIMSDVSAISFGYSHSAALKRDGSLWMWGANNSGQVGNGTSTRVTTPVKIMDGVKDVSLGMMHTLALDADGTVWAWGSNGSGRLGDGTSQNRLSPVSVLTDAKAISAGMAHSAAVTNDGTAYAWGNGREGALGTSSTQNVYSPKKMVNATGPYGMHDVVCGASFTSVMRASMMSDAFFAKSGYSATDAGTYTVVVKPRPNYCWSDGTTGERSLDWSITRKSVDVAAEEGLVYDGSEQQGVVPGEGYTLSGQVTATNAGTYTATATLVSENYVWADGTSEPKVIEWNIASQPIADEEVVVSGLVYNGTSQTGVNSSDKWGVSGVMDGIDAGSYLVDVIPASNYCWSDGSEGKRSFTWDIAPAPLTAAYVSETVAWNGAPVLAVEVTGFVNGETAETAADYVAPHVVAPDSLTEGSSYELTPEGGSAKNYSFEYVSGTLKVGLTPANIERIAGDYANQTSALISSETFASSEWVVLARDDDFADAMSATGLAGALNCPIVLTGQYGLSSAAAAEVQRLGAKHAYVIGGPGAMPGDFERDLAELGCTVEQRVFGEYAHDTSVECAKLIAQHGGGADAIVAMGTNFQDALSISSFAYAYKLPIFLTVPWGERGLPASAVDAVRGMAGDIWVPGGPGAVPTSQVEGVFEGRTFHRIYGYDGYETSNAIAHHMIESGLLSAESCVVACGAQGPKGTDALAGAALAGRAKAPVLLVNGNSALGGVDYTTVDAGASDGKEAFMKSESPSIAQVWVLGGAFVMPQETVDRISAVLER